MNNLSHQFTPAPDSSKSQKSSAAVICLYGQKSKRISVSQRKTWRRKQLLRCSQMNIYSVYKNLTQTCETSHLCCGNGSDVSSLFMTLPPQSDMESFQRNSLELIRSCQNTRNSFWNKNLDTTTCTVNLPTALLVKTYKRCMSFIQFLPVEPMPIFIQMAVSSTGHLLQDKQ